MKYHTKIQKVMEDMNLLGRLNSPFLFIIDFEMENPLLYPTHDLPEDVWFSFNGKGNAVLNENDSIKDYYFRSFPMNLEDYSKGFNTVMDAIKNGNTFLTNLTFPTEVKTSLSFEDIYRCSTAKYKLKYNNEWMVFSPEPFIKVKNGVIKTFPMKGTIDASIPNAVNLILNDPKEKAEHNTVVDLLRNDLSKVARKVRVTNYRYIDAIKTRNKEILQVSSTISGEIKDYYNHHLGELLMELLPAGSVSGAPKNKTCQIIKEAEGQPRGYYTGVAVYYDGMNIDSCVLIRYLENRGGNIYAKSGGGITFMSDLESEYQEMIDKVYVPIDRNHQNRERESHEYPMAQHAI